MRKKFFICILLIFYRSILSEPLCKEKENYCEKCNPLTNLCIQCIYDSFISDNRGGCTGKCILGKNYCNKCDDDNKICQKCEEGFYQDKIGGCSITQNCEISYRGECKKCNNDYILVGEEKSFKVCKNLNSDDLKNCKVINTTNGLCNECKEGYYQNKGDYKCTKIENCNESIYGVCTSCIYGYYLNLKKQICQKSEKSFYNCKQTLDEINCDICDKNYYLSDDGQCVDTIMCSKTNGTKCGKCMSNYKLLENGSCSKEENCKKANKNTGLCELCMQGYYLNNRDKKCRSNQENNEFKYCEIYDDGCKQCENRYFISEDLKCVRTPGCEESENGICLKCLEKYYMGLDKNCSITENCIYSGKDLFYGCDECKPNYCYNIFTKECFPIKEDVYNNCKKSYGHRCSLCHKNFYLNDTDSLCYDNTDKNDIFYKCEKTDYFGNYCFKCEEGYYLGLEDRLCSKIENCKISKNEDECIECNEGYCLDVKKQKCIKNNFLEDEKNKIYIMCNRTNAKGDKCEECLEGYEVGEEGHCVNIKKCLEKNDGICVKCGNKTIDNYNYNYCANRVFGCIPTYIQNCVKCENIFNLFTCTQCEDGYTFKFGMCSKN